jgi:hypothetical protein
MCSYVYDAHSQEILHVYLQYSLAIKMKPKLKNFAQLAC